MRHSPLLAAAFLLTASAATAGEIEPSAAIGVERHYTSNALDSELALEDWYTLIRGSLKHETELSGTHIKLGGEFQATLYDEYDFENDMAVALSGEATRKLSERLEIRGTLSWRRFSEGDDLPLAGLVLPTSTPTDVLTAGTEIGVDLGQGLALVAGALDTIEVPRETRFPGLPIADLRLNPRRNSARLSAALTRSSGPYAYGLRGSFQNTSADPFPLGVGYRLAMLRAEGKFTGPSGLTLAGAFGMQFLSADLDLYEDWRPTGQVAVIKKFASGLELRGSYAATYESTDTDDPLASYLQRLEVEAKAPLRREIVLGIGLYLEMKRNLLLGYDERSKGAYAEIAYHLTPTSDVVLRVDYSRDRLTVIDAQKNAVDAYVGVTKRI